MITNDFFLVNAFTGAKARGNQACVLMLDDLNDTNKLALIAKDFNLPATTFLAERDDGYDVRWFAPQTEIGLCGHGTIAATWILMKLGELKFDSAKFYYHNGVMVGDICEEGVQITGNTIHSRQVEIPDNIQRGFHGKVVDYYVNNNKDIVLIDTEQSVREMKPNWGALRESQKFGYVITAASVEYDFISRTILPYVSFLEDQATGSSHMILAPFWSKRLGKTKMHAFQASERGGTMLCMVVDGKVTLNAECQVFGQGVLI